MLASPRAGTDLSAFDRLPKDEWKKYIGWPDGGIPARPLRAAAWGSCLSGKGALDHVLSSTVSWEFMPCAVGDSNQFSTGIAA
jgi:hypothetical protein